MPQTIAIGDVHGSYSALLEVIEPLIDSGKELVFLGDLFDRSPEEDGDRKVLEFVRDLCDHSEDYGLANVEVLMGNHEQLLLDAILFNDMELWMFNGGNPDFAVWLIENPSQLEWLESFPLYLVRGSHLLVHAGVKPNVPLSEQRPEDLLWIRDNEPHNLPYYVVHGHTIHKNVTEYEDRVAIDTGAFHTGNLSTYAL